MKQKNLSNPLRDWLENEQIPQWKFAEKVGISQPYLNQLLAGKRTPSADVAQRIEAATKGAVRCRTIWSWGEHQWEIPA
jgi:DNA-binding transcriptional regulator YdaS (Cro superfamily)